MSIFATFVSSISYLALPGNAFQTDWNAFVFSLSIPVAAFITLKFFIPLYRKVNSPSAYTYLEKRFGPWARIYVSACYLLTQLIRVGTILYLLALPLHAFSGGMLYIPVSILFLFIGTALFAFYSSGAAELPVELRDITKSDLIFPHFIVTQLPAGITGLLVASIFAAGMSTVSTSFNSSATVFIIDYYKEKDV